MNHLGNLKQDVIIVDDNNQQQTEISIIEEEVETCQIVDNDQCFVALHIGAGFHSVAKTGAYRILCEKICEEVIVALKKGIEARRAVAFAIELLEVRTIFVFRPFIPGLIYSSGMKPFL